MVKINTEQFKAQFNKIVIKIKTLPTTIKNMPPERFIE